MSIYRKAAARVTVERWCTRTLDVQLPEARRHSVSTPLGPTHLTQWGDGPAQVLVLPGTNLNAATSLPWTRPLASGSRVTVADLPGQPGLSAEERPRGPLSQRYSGWISAVLASLEAGPVVVVGESLGAVAALSTPPGHRISGVALVAPAGLLTARVGMRTLAASTPWLLQATPQRSARLVASLCAPHAQPQPELVDWMTLVGTTTHTSLAPPPLPNPVLRRWTSTPLLLVAGQHDRLFPLRALRARGRELLGAPQIVATDGGHFVSHESPEAVAAAISRHVDSILGTGTTGAAS